MGEAKRRRKQDPSYGRSAYRLALRTEAEPIADIEFQVQRQSTLKETDRRAQAVSVVIFAYLQEPGFPDNWEKVCGAIGHDSAAALKQLASESPFARFAAKLFTPTGEAIGDFATHQDLVGGELLGRVWADQVYQVATR